MSEIHSGNGIGANVLGMRGRDSALAIESGSVDVQATVIVVFAVAAR